MPPSEIRPQARHPDALHRRGNGKVSLKWTEAGREHSTTKTNESEAIAWTGNKARELSRTADGTRIVTATQTSQLNWLDRLERGPGFPRTTSFRLPAVVPFSAEE